jgi:cobalt/nickel transport system permease protein
MHISEGILNPATLTAGWTAATVATGIGLRALDDEQIPRASVLAATLFTVSLIHVPVGVSHAHLVLNGLAGLIIGWPIFPIFMIALLLQALLFQFGGFTTLGVNTIVMAVPALVDYYLFRSMLPVARTKKARFTIGFIAGSSAILMSTALLAGVLALNGREFLPAAGLITLVNLPLAIVEGVVTGAAVVFLLTVKPEIFSRGKS